MQIEQIPLDQIRRPTNPDRIEIDNAKINELADSLKREGLLQPVILRPAGDGRYEIIAGDRRVVAMRQLGWATTPAIVREDLGDHIATTRFTENTQREDLTPMEDALALHRLREERRCTVSDLTQIVNRSTTWVRQRLTLLTLPAELKELVHTRVVAVSTALYLAEIDDDEHRNYLLSWAQHSGASAEVIREWVNEWKNARDAGIASDAQKPPMPPPGQPVVILIPCYICSEAKPHTEMVIVRLCKECHAGVHNFPENQPIKPPTPGTCRVCGCTGDRACWLSSGPCAWADSTNTLCTNPKCLHAAQAAMAT